MDLTPLLAVFISFMITILVLPIWIHKAKDIKLIWEDMNKYNHPKNVSGSGGVVVIMAFTLGVLTYIFLKTFLYEGTLHDTEIFALLATVLILSFVGIIDDLLGWHKGGLSQRTKSVLAMVAAVPLIVINVGNSVINLPLIGTIDFGIIYPLIIIPLAIGFVSNAYNCLAGFNGLEAGMGIISLTYLSIVAYLTGSPWLGVIGLTMVGSLVGFWWYNKNPAKVFPGDTLTYGVGALIVVMAILGNFEKIAIIIFIPYIIEFLLKARGKFKKHSFAKPSKDGHLTLKYKKIYGLTHFAVWTLSKVKKKVTENDVVYFIYAIQIICILISIASLVKL